MKYYVQSLNQWRPKWDDESAYATLIRASDEVLAWEFLRRSRQYAIDWLHQPKLLRESFEWIQVATDEYILKNVSQIDLDEYFALCDRYMVHRLYHPKTSAEKVVFKGYLPPHKYLYSKEDPHFVLRSPSDIFIKFSVDRPLSRQLHAAKRLLDQHQQRVADRDKNKQRRSKSSDYVRLLRLLDGRYKDVKFRVLGDALCTSEDANVEQRATDLHADAEDICNWKYRLFCLELAFR